MIFDKLDKIFETQHKFQTKLGVFEKISESFSMKQQYINQMILACHEEIVEIMRETAYKNPEFMPFGWKKNQKFNGDKMKDEIVDLLHFIINLSLVSEMDANELYLRYCKKNGVNYDRQEKNY